MATAKDVAQYLLKLDEQHGGEGISNLKLQKLAYYSQVFFGAIYDKPLFNERVEAWTHGPVIPDLYHEYKCHGSNLIPSSGIPNETSLSKEEAELVSEVYDVFGQFSAWKLRNMTHEESPWKDNEDRAGEISFDEMKRYFKTRIE